MALSGVSVRSLLGSVGRAGSAHRQRGGNGASGEARAQWSARERGGGPPRLNSDWRQTVRARLLVCAGALGLWTAGIEARLVYLQVVDHADLMNRADRQQMRTAVPPAKRGEIFDRKGRVLAYSVDADTIPAVPTDIDDAAGAAPPGRGAPDPRTPGPRPATAKRPGPPPPFSSIARPGPPQEAPRRPPPGRPRVP